MLYFGDMRGGGNAGKLGWQVWLRATILTIFGILVVLVCVWFVFGIIFIGDE